MTSAWARLTESKCKGGSPIFGFSSRNSRPTIDRHQSLTAIPVLNEGVSLDDDQAGNLVIHVKLKRGKGFLARFQPPFLVRTVKLDELGSFVFRQIDGKASTLEIIERFIARYRTNRREAELSTVGFLKSLMQRGVISVAVK